MRPLANGQVMLETRGDFRPGNILDIRVTLAGLEAQELKLGFNGEFPRNIPAGKSFAGKNDSEIGMTTRFEVPPHAGVFNIELYGDNGETVVWRIADRRPAPEMTSD